MGKGKKPFIDRKKSVTFHLVHRSQHDPLAADETAPQRVLVEASSNQSSIKPSNDVDRNTRLKEQQKYGIMFDDDYNYLQHLKQLNHDVVWEAVENPNHAGSKGKETVNAPKLQLPSSVFASDFEEVEGLLNRKDNTGFRLDLDPDVVAALDDDFDYENNEIEDDFVIKAMDSDDIDDGSDNEDEFEENMLSESSYAKEEEDVLGPLMREKRFNKEELKSRFTDYSMTSSVIRRNEQLTLLDDRFESFYSSYDEPELGDLCMENIAGTWHQKHPSVTKCLKSYKKDEIEPYNKEWDRVRLAKYLEDVGDIESTTSESTEGEEEDKETKWDCESIISTYSTLYNHPQLIEEPSSSKKQKSNPPISKIEVNQKTGIPMDVLHNNGITKKALATVNEISGSDNEKHCSSLCAKSHLTTLSMLSIRPKDETPEEKKERKKLLKEYRNERRIEKKANTEAFKMEKKRQIHIKINQIANQTGKKII